MTDVADVLSMVATGLVALGAALAWAFVYRYAWTRWERSVMGRFVMALVAIIGVFLTLAAVVRLFGPYPGREVVAVVLYALLAWLLARMHVLLSASQRDGRELHDAGCGHDDTH